MGGGKRRFGDVLPCYVCGHLAHTRDAKDIKPLVRVHTDRACEVCGKLCMTEYRRDNPT